MVWVPLEVGWVRCRHKLYVMPDLSKELMLGEDWQSGGSAQLKFDHPALTLGEVKIPLGGDRNQAVPLVAKRDIKYEHAMNTIP